MQITITGVPGSGKSTVAKMLAKRQGYVHHSIGDWMRHMALDRGFHDLNKLADIAEADPSIDRELDNRTRDLAKEDNFVLDARLGYYFLPKSFKIFLDCDLKEAARRIFFSSRPEENYGSEEATLRAIKERIKSEAMRYKKYYDIDINDKSVYDLIIDTTKKKPEAIVGEIIEKLK